MILLLLTIAATICTACMALAMLVLALGHRGDASKAFLAILTYPAPVIAILWILYARVP